MTTQNNFFVCLLVVLILYYIYGIFIWFAYFYYLWISLILASCFFVLLFSDRIPVICHIDIYSIMKKKSESYLLISFSYELFIQLHRLQFCL